MKILAVRGCNLASLSGEFEINFDHPPLKDTGLFAITGPTGSGKSTILDAICLALYDQIPRLQHAAARKSTAQNDESVDEISQNDPRHILSRGKGEAWAEVEFIAQNGKNYRSHWHVRRARKSPTGKLQFQTMQLMEINSQQLIGRTRKQVLAEIKSLLGLDFQQFKRSVLLAQGDFTNFMRAEEKERASLLEQMTGTEIYSRISMQAFEQFKLRRIKLEQLTAQLDGIQIFNKQQREQLEEQSKAIQERLKGIQDEKMVLLDQQAWFIQQRKTSDKLVAVEQKIKSLNNDWQSLSQNRDTLQLLEKALPLQGAFQQLQNVKAYHAQLEQELKQLNERQKNNQLVIEQARIEKQQANLHLGEIQQRMHAKQAEIEQAQKLDVLIVEQSKISESLKDKYEQCLQSLDKEKLKTAEIEQEINTIQSQFDQHNTWMSEHLWLKEVASDWKHWKHQLGEMIDTEKTIEELKGEQHKHQTLLNDKHAKLVEINKRVIAQKNEIEQLLQRKFNQELISQSEQELVQEYEQLKQQQHDIELGIASQNLDAEMTEQKAQLNTIQESLAQTNMQYIDHKARFTEAQNSLDQIRLVQSASVKKLREQLKEGQPCMVCGSENHPLVRHDEMLDEQLEGFIDRRDQLQLRLQDCTDELASLKLKAEQLEIILDELGNKRQELNLQLKSRPDCEYLLDNDGLEDLLQLKVEASNSLQELLKAVRSEHYEKAQHQLMISQNENSLLQERNKLDVIQAECQAIEAQNKQREQAISAAYETGSRLRQALYFLDDLDKVRQEKSQQIILEQLIKEWNEHESIVHESEAKLLQYKQRKIHYGERMEQLQSELSELLAEKQVHEKVFQANKLDRKNILDGQPVEAFRQQIRAQLEQAEKSARQSADFCSRAEQDTMALKKQLEDLNRKNNKTMNELQQQTTNFEGKLIDEGLSYSTISEILSYPEKQVSLWKQQLKDCENSLIKNKTLSKEYQQQLEEGLKSRPNIEETHIAEKLLMLEKETEQSEKEGLTIYTQLAQDDQQKLSSQQLCQEIEDQKNKLEVWDQLNQLIGSADGHKFRLFAQSLTLDILLHYANQHLVELSGRYQLQRLPGFSLDLQVIDQDMGDEVRGVHSLSGGESFLASLALALGLSSISSGTAQIQSLFIDEGFGTLDSESLEVALSCLDNLQAGGRQVGVISHVEALLEIVACRIEVDPYGKGQSKISVIG
ncbi:MAG: AAA family ATPase [bacterium]